MKLSNELIKEIEKEIVEGYISKRKHLTADIYILNYTPKASNGWYWSEATKTCRGLIVDADYNIYAKSYYKFFATDQLEDLSIVPMDEKCVVYDKVDGFLAIMYFIDGIPYIASRGSFESDQAVEGTKILREKYSHIKFDPKLSYVFELIYPNDILTYDFGDRRELILHGIFENESCKEIPLWEYEPLESMRLDGLPIIETFESSDEFDGFDKIIEKYPFEMNREGFVVRFESGFRIKLKYDEYKNLSHLKNVVSSKNLIELIISGGINDLLDEMPEHVKTKVKDMEDKMYSEYEKIYTESYAMLKKHFSEDKATFAKSLMSDKSYSSVVFAMYAKPNIIEDVIWKIVKNNIEAAENV